jgi:outer membrane protein
VRAEAVLLVLAAACGPVHMLTRPEGDGGWSPARRRAEIETRAAAAGVHLDATPPAAPAGPLDLHAALALAATGNRRIADADRDVDFAGTRVREARGRLFPATTGVGRYSWFTSAQTNSVTLPAGVGLRGFTPTVVVRDREQGVLSGTIALPLDVSGELRHTLAAAQAGYRGERARRWATTLAQQSAVIDAYFTLLQAERLREVTDQTLALQRTQLTNAQSRFENGRLTKNELLVVQVALRDAEQERLQRDLGIAQARWALNALLGLDVDAPTEVVDVRAAPDVPGVDEALHTAYAQNPVLAALLEEQQRLEALTTALVRSRLPRLQGGGTADWTTPEILHPQEIGSGFVGFSWDLGTDGRREADIAGARIAADRNRIALEQELRELESAVRLAQRSTEERIAAQAAAEAAVGQAEENLRIRTQQFDAGRATSEDVLEAQALLASQRATLATALYQAHARRAQLQELMGLALDDTPSPPR